MTYEHATDAAVLATALGAHRRWFVLTGAGCSTDSGIPAYRDENGVWQHKAPIQYADFRAKEAVRKRYWARSFVGFERMRRARPNAAHGALAELEMAGRVEMLATQNVDGLHQLAGSQRVIDLHGRLALVACLGCRAETSRERLQAELEVQNPSLARAREVGPAPDGDAEVDTSPWDTSHGDMLRVPVCSECGGVLKPAVVFFGETVPPERVARAYAALEASDAVLVVGSSLSVFSGYRFVRRAHEQGKPIVILNRGVTRADAIAKLKISGPCGPLLSAAVGLLARASEFRGHGQ